MAFSCLTKRKWFIEINLFVYRNQSKSFLNQFKNIFTIIRFFRSFLVLLYFKFSGANGGLCPAIGNWRDVSFAGYLSGRYDRAYSRKTCGSTVERICCNSRYGIACKGIDVEKTGMNVNNSYTDIYYTMYRIVLFVIGHIRNLSYFCISSYSRPKPVYVQYKSKTYSHTIRTNSKCVLKWGCNII